MTSQPSTTDLRVVFAAQDITNAISDVTPNARRFGGSADIHQGVWASDSGAQVVAIKFIRSGEDELEKTLRRHRREITMWYGIDHPNILRLLGLYWGSGRQLPAMVSTWCQHTSLRHFVKEVLPGPDVMAQKYTLLKQVLSGLAHLHNLISPIVHGDLKGDNILVSEDSIPKICDFGLSKIPDVTTETSTHVRGTCRWMAPELLLDEGPVSTAGNIWAYACVIVEVLTGLLPYPNIQKEVGVVVALARRQIPARPADASDACWNLALKCFAFYPPARPSASELLQEPLFALVGPSAVSDNSESQSPGTQSRTGTSTNRRVKLFVVAAAKLPRKVFRAPNPLAVVTVDGEHVLTTNRVKNSCNPYWNETCDIEVTPHSVVKVEVQNETKQKSKHPKRASMGTMSFRIGDYLNLSLNTDQHKVLERGLPPLREDFIVVGSLKLILHLRAFGMRASPTLQHTPSSTHGTIYTPSPTQRPALGLRWETVPYYRELPALPARSPSISVGAEFLSRTRARLANAQQWIPAGVRLSVSLFSNGREAEVAVLSVDVHASVILLGQLVHAPQVLYVALKVFRPELSAADRTLLLRELASCSQIEHQHILPFMGTASWESDTILVAPYMKNGNLTNYLEAHPRADRATLMLQVADAVRFLHDDAQPRRVHGNLKCENVLVSDSGNALLESKHFSLTMREQSEDTPTTVTEIRQYHTLRFAAPELLVDSMEDETFLPLTAGPTRRSRSKTTATDVYAFAMMMLQAYSGEDPWRGITNTRVYVEVEKGQPPPRPSAQYAAPLGFTDQHWNLCVSCWSRNPELRPSMRRVLRTLEELKPQ